MRDAEGLAQHGLESKSNMIDNKELILQVHKRFKANLDDRLEICDISHINQSIDKAIRDSNLDQDSERLVEGFYDTYIGIVHRLGLYSGVAGLGVYDLQSMLDDELDASICSKILSG